MLYEVITVAVVARIPARIAPSSGGVVPVSGLQARFPGGYAGTPPAGRHFVRLAEMNQMDAI